MTTSVSPSSFAKENVPLSVQYKKNNIRVALLHRLLERLSAGSLRVVLPDGSSVEKIYAQPGPDAVLEIPSWRAVFRLFFGGVTDFSSAYVNREWDSPDLLALLMLGAVNQEIGVAFPGMACFKWVRAGFHAINRNTRIGSRRNIKVHYNLGNDFYRAWLDRGMSYSSALYRSAGQSLEEAQLEKQSRIIELLDLPNCASVLEIGCGWGGLMEQIASRGHRVTGITLSPAQLDYTKNRLEMAGLSASSQAVLQDYRDLDGQFDAVVSIEMFEAVGTAYWATYFERLRQNLRPGGTAVLQVITISERRYKT